MNSYKPDDPVRNAVLWMSASSIANCKYPWARSNEVNQTVLSQLEGLPQFEREGMNRVLLRRLEL